ncbi:DEAD/DEAH box helicase [Streptococcus cuniculipharyngis]|uniref:DEAD/DEAH box helicase n=1 Tax=Streptococcus cuniculipharyngis TaxID=1562651 RepID=A0A5C5SCZ1_9STRE|nr:DEAD/DEAH box helicase [Streptococcus cuniculipharyngis]TWS98152.1 DEAD/DEAH box helicase [Streptococcus cuniculipharyngis]
MGRMIPGRVRNEGIALYDQGLVIFLDEKDELIEAQVAGIAICYSFNDHLVHCACQSFAEKDYCVHLAAVEHALNKDNRFKNRQAMAAQSNLKAERTKSFGSLFLEGLASNQDRTTTYRLSVQGQFSPYASDIWWTLKINRLPDQRTYIIRDIRAFLTTVKKETGYQINKQYFEPLSLLKFDQPSQALIRFLWRMLPKGNQSITAVFLPNQGRHLSLFGGFFEEGLGLFQNLHEFRFEDGETLYEKLECRELSPDQPLYSFDIVEKGQQIELLILEKSQELFFDHDYLWFEGVFYRLTVQQSRLVGALRSLPLEDDGSRRLTFNLEDKAQLAAVLPEFQLLGQVNAPLDFMVKDFVPQFDVDLLADGRLLLSLTFDYGEHLVRSRQDLSALPYTSHFQHEEEVFQTLLAHGFQGDFQAHHVPLTSKNIYDFFAKTVPSLEALGTVRLSQDIWALRAVSRPQVLIDHSGGLLEVSFDFSGIDEADVSQAMTALFNHQAHFISQEGQLILFDQETQGISDTLHGLKLSSAKDNRFLLAPRQAYQLSQAVQGLDSVRLSEDFQQLAYDLTHPEAFQLDQLVVKAELRDYQLVGVRWFNMLDHYGFGGILADDMGLGKTLQTIAFLSSKVNPESKVLILAPSSLIYNWQDEFVKFAPQLDVVVSYGQKAVRDQCIAENHQVTITSYASFRQDFEAYRAHNFDYLILDEAQVMKNNQTKIAQHLRQFPAKRCFALSGTPIENKLQEIWSIFQIVLPGLLPSLPKFVKMPPSLVARYIGPFVMRRKKEDVLPELPDLMEIVYHNELVDEQKAIYLAQLRQMQERVRETSAQDFQSQKMEILSGIMRLRQICDTPALFMPYQGSSGKLESLRQLLTQLRESGHRALIFSQFRGMLDLIELELGQQGLTSYKITGSTPASLRQEMTRSFNEGQGDFFLISLKAGGVGLNLTGADTVVLIDLWWNPAVEMQAIGRAHRLGQKRNVEVYRLITRGTIEEKILALQENKRHLITTVLDGKESRSNLSLAEVRQILGLD